MDNHVTGTQQLGNVRLLLILAGILLASPDLNAQTDTPDPQREEIALAFKNDGIKKPYFVALDQIGIVANENMTRVEVLNLATELEGTLVHSDGSGLHIIKLSAKMVNGRKELNLLARNLRDKKQVGQAGLVLYRGGYQTPLVAADQLVVEFKNNVTEAMAKEFAVALGLKPITNSRLLPQLWLYQLEKENELDVLAAAELASEDKLVSFALPNFFLSITPHQITPDDTYFYDQWHLRNTGQNEGTFDADIDSELAWALTQGDEDIVIAIIDTGFDIDHEDLVENLWHNTEEDGKDSNGDSNEPNGIDDDGNNHIDDINGYDFTECTHDRDTNPPPGCGSGTIKEFNHGTAVAGVAAGRGNNTKGISGVCPNCSLMLISQPGSSSHYAYMYAIEYVGQMGADILNNSWGYGPGQEIPTYLEDAIDATATQYGTIIFWSMDNRYADECTVDNAGFGANDKVISISAASNWDKKVTEAGYGDCLDLLAPSYGGYGPDPIQPAPPKLPIPGYPYTGSLNMATTDRANNPGYNNTSVPNTRPGADMSFCTDDSGNLDEYSNPDYTKCFSGTSAAAPVAAGIGGLILSVDNTLSREQVQNLLQDTADKIEPGEANYNSDSGKSSHNNTSTHGYGRVNAFEAVRVIAPVTKNEITGLGGTDIFIRDNTLDWGNTAQQVANAPSWRAGSNVKMEKIRGIEPHYESVDIKVDAPPYKAAPTTSALFDGFIHEDPISGAVNKVYVRVHNRGPKPAANVRVKLHWAWAGTALPQLPNDFWAAWPADSTMASSWHTVGSEIIQEVRYSGASVAGDPNDPNADVSEIVSFDFPGPPLDPSEQAFRHHCLFAVIDSPDDPVNETRIIPDIVTPTNNNVTHRNLSVQDASTSSSNNGLMVRNPFGWPISTRLKLVKPKHWKVSLSKFGDGQPFELAAGQEVPILVSISPADEKGTGEVEVRQEIMFEKQFQFFGGYVYRFSSD